jgi:ASC-1-like (ASCH) protein
MKKGDTIIFTNNELGFDREVSVIITSVVFYKSFKSYLTNETLKKCLPGITSIANGEKVYHKFYSKTDEHKYGIVSIRIKVM